MCDCWKDLRFIWHHKAWLFYTSDHGTLAAVFTVLMCWLMKLKWLSTWQFGMLLRFDLMCTIHQTMTTDKEWGDFNYNRRNKFSCFREPILGNVSVVLVREIDPLLVNPGLFVISVGAFMRLLSKLLQIILWSVNIDEQSTADLWYMYFTTNQCKDWQIYYWISIMAFFVMFCCNTCVLFMYTSAFVDKRRQHREI